MGVDPDPSPFLLEAGSTGVLLIHGFTGSPTEMRLMGEYLHEKGVTVSAPLLLGHGTTPEDLNGRTWKDWQNHAEGALNDLNTGCEHVFVGGLSLGALISFRLAARRSDLSGMVAYSPAIEVTDWRSYLLPVIKYLIPQLPKPDDHFTDPQAKKRLWSYDTYPTKAAHEVLKLIRKTRKDIPRVDCPLLMIYSEIDKEISIGGVRSAYENVGTPEKEILSVDNSGHVLTLDSQWKEVARTTYEFMASHSPLSG